MTGAQGADKCNSAIKDARMKRLFTLRPGKKTAIIQTKKKKKKKLKYNPPDYTTFQQWQCEEIKEGFCS